MSVIALGSINMDLVVKVPRLPSVGETLIGHEFFSAFGGKGANQAVAVAKLGVPVFFVGQVGDDDFGQTLTLALKASGVNISGLRTHPELHSGVASIVVSETGENTIACAAGANGAVDEVEVEFVRSHLPETQVLLLELGIPFPVVLATAQAAHELGVTVILDPAPAPDGLPDSFYPLIDILTPNEVEASHLVGFPVEDRPSAEQAAQILQEKGVQNVIITLGEQGALWQSSQGSLWYDSYPVTAIDTVAAGDAFNGALAAAIASRKPLSEALHWGMVAGALSVTKNGAQPSLPDQKTFFSALESWQ
ncbi:ribokinase [Spirulina subsalsa]|uniref:ribokinase n=1 Tax=Spirulina subsalsa TaxID=54311 RepID=UPI00031AF792|nr:ribokinase [Spirulina subsalsa]